MSFSQRRSLAIAGLATGAFCFHDLYLFPQAPKRSDATILTRRSNSWILDISALETHLEEMALAMRVFLGRLPPDEPRLKEVPTVIEEAASLLSRTNVK